MNEEERRSDAQETVSENHDELDGAYVPVEEVTAEPAALSNEPKSSPLHRTASGIFEYLELFAWSIFAVLIIFTFAFRLCTVDGESMENTLHNEEKLLLFSLGYTPKQDDIVVFQINDNATGEKKTLVKRVIATEGQEIIIDTRSRVITVDGKAYADSHSILKDYNDNEIGVYYTSLFGHSFDPKTGIFHATVPENAVFLMGDNRNNSKDSRNPTVGFVDKRQVLGKVFLRIAPFTVFS